MPVLDPGYHADPAVAFAERIRALLRDRGWTQKDLATRMGCSPQYINDIVAGRRRPPPPAFVTEMAATLHADPTLLLLVAGHLPQRLRAALLDRPEMARSLLSGEEQNGVRHVTVAFSDDAYRTLQDLAVRKGTPLADTIRDAIALEKMFQDTQREGGRFLLERDGEIHEVVNR